MAGVGAPQADWSFNPVIAFAGMRNRTSAADLVVHYPASAACPPGVLLEVTVVSGVPSVRPAQSATGALAPLAGVCMFDDAHVLPPATLPGVNAATYNIGEMVPVLRKGEIWTSWTGTTQGTLVTANYVHSSDGSHSQGFVTDAATSTTTGNEIDNLPGGFRIVRPTTAPSGVVLMELNLPGS